MPRPLLPRRVCCQVEGRGFRPIGVPAWKSDAISMGLDGLEAIRLADLEGLYQDAAAERMGVSRQTYARILSRARQAVAASLVERRMLIVEPAPGVQEAASSSECPVHGGPRRQGRTCHCPSPHDGPCGEDCRCGSGAAHGGPRPR